VTGTVASVSTVVGDQVKSRQLLVKIQEANAD